MSFFTSLTTTVSDILNGTNSLKSSDKYGLLLAGVVACLLAFLQLVLTDPDREAPPVAPSSIPLIGHELSYRTDRGALLNSLRGDTTRPRPYTITLFGRKVYAFFHPQDAETLWQRENSLSWETLEVDRHRTLYGLRDEDAAFLYRSHDSLLRKYMELNKSLMKHDVADGGRFKPMITSFATENENAIAELLRTIDEDGEIETDLHFWIMDYTMRMAMCSIWGTRNPYAGMATRTQKDEFLKAFFEFDEESPNLLQGLLRLGGVDNQREMVTRAFKAFYVDPKENLSDPFADFALRRAALADEVGMSVDGLARMDFAFLHSSLQNTRPVAFWCLYYLFSPNSTNLLADIRAELKDTGAVKLEQSTGKATLDIGKIATSCPLLNSLWNEVLRFHHDVIYTRHVEEQTSFPTADDTIYTLRRRNEVVIPSATLMRDPWIWGEAAETFDPYRFSKESESKAEKSDAEKEKFELRRQAFRPFGGGEKHCPGRGFAWVEVATLVATFATMFDVDLLEDEKMRTKRNGMQMVTPVEHCRVRIRPSRIGKNVMERVYVQP